MRNTSTPPIKYSLYVKYNIAYNLAYLISYKNFSLVIDKYAGLITH